MSPSKIRREGRRAYESGYDLCECPYTSSWKKSSWLEGYLERQKEDNVSPDETPLLFLREEIADLDESPQLIAVLTKLFDAIEGNL